MGEQLLSLLQQMEVKLVENPKCKHCGSDKVVGISRVVGYYSTINNWNPGKKAEFEDRQKGNYKISGESE